MKESGKRIRLKQFRVGLQLTQQEVADKLHITSFSYAAIENGKRDGSFQFWTDFQTAFNIADSDMYALMKKEGKSLETDKE